MHAKEFASVVNTKHISTEKGNPIGAHPIWKEKKDSNLLGKIGHHTGVWPKLACFKHVIDLSREERCLIIFIIIRIKYFESRRGTAYTRMYVYDAITVTTYCPVNLTYNYLEKLQDSLSDIITQILRLYALQVQLKSRKHNVPKINKRNNVSTQTGSGCFLFNNLYTSLFVYA